jgi:DNA-binding helix-hairpin-helix protein with protein kinase domain
MSSDREAGQKCGVCSMPFAAHLGSCPSCAYDRRAAAEAGATHVTAHPAGRDGTGRGRGLRWWKSRR